MHYAIYICNYIVKALQHAADIVTCAHTRRPMYKYSGATSYIPVRRSGGGDGRCFLIADYSPHWPTLRGCRFDLIRYSLFPNCWILAALADLARLQIRLDSVFIIYTHAVCSPIKPKFRKIQVSGMLSKPAYNANYAYHVPGTTYTCCTFSNL